MLWMEKKLNLVTFIYKEKKIIIVKERVIERNVCKGILFILFVCVLEIEEFRIGFCYVVSSQI